MLRDLLHVYQTWRDERDPIRGLQSLTRGKASFPMDIHLEKVYFHWSTRTQQSLGWFKEEMDRIWTHLRVCSSAHRGKCTWG